MSKTESLDNSSSSIDTPDTLDSFDYSALDAGLLKFVKPKGKSQNYENECFLVKVNTTWFVNPENRFKVIWDHAQLLLLFYIGTIVCYKICFFEEFSDLEIIFNFLIEIFFLLDMIFTFLQPVHLLGEYKYDRRESVKHYLRGWFLVDLLAVFPFHFFFEHISQSSEYTFILRTSRLPRLYKLLRGLRIIRAVKMTYSYKNTIFGRVLYFFKKYENFIFTEVLVFFGVFLYAHICACIWYLISKGSHSKDNWILSYEFESPYTASLYFVFSTLSTTGYGDIVPSTVDEYIFTFVLCLSAIFIHAYLFLSMLNHYMDKNSEKRYEIQKKRNLLKSLVKDNVLDRRVLLGLLPRIKLDLENYYVGNQELKLHLLKDLSIENMNRVLTDYAEVVLGFENLPILREIDRKYWPLLAKNSKIREYL